MLLLVVGGFGTDASNVVASVQPLKFSSFYEQST